ILDNNFKLLEQNQEDDLYKAKIKLPDETRPNDLLQNLMPHLVINSFNEIIPTMNDIFIAKVKKNIDAKYNNA
ncbi:MAG: DUF4162 domain-containing protein, partial [Bacteroidales bacterium]|nr:DUF4162 domain-containing protein [Bacteroidales bacterium]